MNTTAVVISPQDFEINFDDDFQALASCQGQRVAVIDTMLQESEEEAKEVEVMENDWWSL